MHAGGATAVKEEWSGGNQKERWHHCLSCSIININPTTNNLQPPALSLILTWSTRRRTILQPHSLQKHHGWLSNLDKKIFQPPLALCINCTTSAATVYQTRIASVVSILLVASTKLSSSLVIPQQALATNPSLFFPFMEIGQTKEAGSYCSS